MRVEISILQKERLYFASVRLPYFASIKLEDLRHKVGTAAHKFGYSVPPLVVQHLCFLLSTQRTFR